MLYTAYNEVLERAKEVKYLGYREPFKARDLAPDNWIMVESGELAWNKQANRHVPDGETAACLHKLWQELVKVVEEFNPHNNHDGIVFSMNGMLPKAGFCLISHDWYYMLYIVLDTTELVRLADERLAKIKEYKIPEKAYRVALERERQEALEQELIELEVGNSYG